MTNVKVCISNCCYRRSAYAVEKLLCDQIAARGLTGVIHVSSAYIRDGDIRGVSLMIDETPVSNVNTENIDDIFKRDILPREEKARGNR